MKKLKFLLLGLIGIPLSVILLFTLLILFHTHNWNSPKYGTGIDTAAYFGRDAEYHLIKTDVYSLYDQVNREQLDPMVYRYCYKNEVVYVEGVTGFTVIDVEDLKVYKYEKEEELPIELLNIFNNEEFKEVDSIRYSKFVHDGFITKDGGGFGGPEAAIYLGYDRESYETENFLNNNQELVIEEIRNIYNSHTSAEITSINFKLEDILSEKFSINIESTLYNP